MRFWDTSAIVPLILDESAAAPVDRSYDDSMIVWWGTIIEATSAIARRERAGTLSIDAASESLVLLANIALRWTEVPASEPVRRTAQRLVRTHVLRAADSLQLAAALTVAANQPEVVEFICRDTRLTEAAAREGLRVRAT